MSLRIFSIVICSFVAACGAPEDDKVASAKPDDRIECALAGAVDFGRSCAVEKGEGTRLILRHSDGGFRAVELDADGTLSAADGSDVAGGKMLSDGRFELVLGADRYRLPPR